MATSIPSHFTVTSTTLMVDGNHFDITTPEGRMAARAYAYTVAADGDTETKRKILKVVKRNDG